MTEKTWQKITIKCPAALEDAIASFVSDLTGCGVEICDQNGGAGESAVITYLAQDDPAQPGKLAGIRAYLAKLAEEFTEYLPAHLELEAIADEDWHRKWKESFKPFHLSKNLVIKPSWEIYDPAPGEKIIEIDPGMAFGTGLHASTKLAALLLEEHLGGLPSSPEATLDVGTGTGILAIAAALFGCKNITAIDNDPQAVASAEINVAANNLSGTIEVGTAGLAELPGPYELILANIIHNTLVEMAPRLSQLLAPAGVLILAGILKGGQADNITKIYSKYGLTLLGLKNSGEWSALSFKRA